MWHLVGLVMISIIAFNPAWALDCGQFTSLYQSPAIKCQCGTFPKNLNPTSPYKNMKLVAVCDYSEHRYENGPPEMRGNFFFRGNQTFLGSLRREDSDFVTEFTFVGEKVQSHPPFYDSVVSLRFEDPMLAQKEFKAPLLDEQSLCWEARIKLRVTEILSLPGENDESGNYARGYTALEIGPYRKCHPH